MKIRITSITAADVGEAINDATTNLEDLLSPVLKLKDYGGDIAQLVVFYISVETDTVENGRYCEANNRVGKYKDLLTGKMTRFVGIAIPVNPSLVLGLNEPALLELFKELLIAKLETPDYAFPKRFDRQRLLIDIKIALAYGVNTIGVKPVEI